MPPTPARCRGLEAVKSSERVYLEAYTSLLLVPKEKLVGSNWGKGASHAPMEYRSGLKSRAVGAGPGP